MLHSLIGVGCNHCIGPYSRITLVGEGVFEYCVNFIIGLSIVRSTIGVSCSIRFSFIGVDYPTDVPYGSVCLSIGRP